MGNLWNRIFEVLTLPTPAPKSDQLCKKVGIFIPDVHPEVGKKWPKNGTKNAKNIGFA